MKKLRNYISFSSFLEEDRYFTQIDLEKETITITSEKKKQVWEGTVEEFKALEKIKANNTDRVYESLLDMAEQLISILTKK